jgi:DNA-binding response OmpR family regulator
VVDDDETSRRSLSRLLRGLGYDVSQADHGRQALEILMADPIDLIITDISMPHMNGYQLLVHLKASTRTRGVPVIVVSANDDVHTVIQCIEHGAEDHFGKPYEPVLLHARIRATLERKHLRDREAAQRDGIARLIAAAEAVGSSSQDSTLLSRAGNEESELGELARALDRIVTDYRTREAKLESRVRELRREIRNAGRRSASR